MRLELRGITKRFPGVLANDRVDLTAESGEILALLGENGAGKTTLMNILYGLYHADEGEILLGGKPVRFESPGDAIAAGIGMVHQHFMLIPVFTVTENVILGVEETGALGLLDRQEARRRVEDISQRYGLAVDPDAMVEDLPVGVQQRVEIVKALYREAEVLILDEPTAVLTPQEIEELFRVMRSLKETGKSIIFITHKLKEVLAIADRITVVRRGKVVGSALPREANEDKLAAMMVGREVELQVKKEESSPGEPVLQVEDLTVLDDRGHVAVDGVSLEVRAGEVVGLAGVQGNGQTELVESITGLRPPLTGRVRVAGQDLTGARPRRVFLAGVAHIPEDRIEDGLVGDFSVADNLVLNTYYLPPFAKGLRRDDVAIRTSAEDRVRQYDIRTPSIQTAVRTLSGGNQQKVIVARELSRPVELLMAAQPTRGLDVGSISYIHEQIVKARDEGDAVLLVSTELDEILSLSDRIAVMYRGKVVAVIEAASATPEDLGLLMAGSAPAASKGLSDRGRKDRRRDPGKAPGSEQG
ncbi:MAG TPA: ABC transporter ATP-binding protein [Actinomycetota bacterium]|nr:ABC transporter ATP-binding protein [Actinomycetota bacterium]